MAGSEATAQTADPKRSARLTLAALGVVFGDIGTSPLYTVKECFSDFTGIAPTHDNVLGILSLITWALIIIVTLKYVVLVMRADNRGEGGVLALMALVSRHEAIVVPRRRRFFIMIDVPAAAPSLSGVLVGPGRPAVPAAPGFEAAAPGPEPE